MQPHPERSTRAFELRSLVLHDKLTGDEEFTKNSIELKFSIFCTRKSFLILFYGGLPMELKE